MSDKRNPIRAAFDRFADAVAHVWESPWWFAVCLAFVLGWVAGLVATQDWNDSAYHLWLNSPTTGLTFLGVFLLHNSTQRFERATNERLENIIEAVCGKDPVQDPGQKVETSSESSSAHADD